MDVSIRARLSQRRALVMKAAEQASGRAYRPGSISYNWRMGVEGLSVGPFVLDRARTILLRDGKPVALGQRALALLGALAEADGAISKQALMEAGWPGTVVEEGNLSVQIAALRKALGKREDGGEWIVTVPRVGYRLVRGDGGESRAGATALAALRRPTLAVLPFVNMSSDPEQEYFADGIVEDLITALSRFSSISVLARNSTYVFKGRAVDMREVALQLGARYVVEGSVRRAGGRLRISAQLVEGETGAHLWAANFDRPLEDVFAVQDEITQSVVAIVEPRIQLAEVERSKLKRPSNLDAYDFYLQARSVVLSSTPGANARAVDLIEHSLALDPDFTPALAVAVAAQIARFDRQQPGASEEQRLKGLAYAHRLLATAGTDAYTRSVAGLGVIILGQEYDSGLVALQQAAADNPNSVIVLGYAGVGAVRSGLLDEAERLHSRAIKLNPTDSTMEWAFTAIANIRVCQGRFEEAVDWATRAQSISNDNPITLWFLIAALAHLGRLDEAKRWRSTLEKALPGCTLASIRAGQQTRDPRHLGVLIDGLRLAGVPER